jgi:uncharacterized repeat protein (TIGR03803 family)
MLRFFDVYARTALRGGLVLALFAPQGAQARSASPGARASEVFYTFTGTSGSQPVAGLIRDSSGNFYGTTSVGGADNVGTVFKIAKNGTETILHSFALSGDGESPWSTLVRDSAGDLYGTTTTGGTDQFGTVFEVAANGTESVLYSFTGKSDGGFPASGLVSDGSGNLYGTAVYGGVAGGGYTGTVYELAPSGEYTVLHAFTGSPDGADPVAGLIRDKHGNLYGTTYEGGAYGAGVVYKIAPNGTETVLYNFCSQAHCSDGGAPNGSLIEDKSGNLYGTTSGGGATNGYGTVFELSPAGAYTVLYSFCSVAQNCTDGIYPYGGVAMDRSGNLYGTTIKSYTGTYGTVFEVTPGGTETVLHHFAGGSDGIHAYATPLVVGSHLYGTTLDGGADNAGIVFKLTK